MGLLSDRFGRRPFVIMGSIALFALAIPAFILINSNVIGLIFAGLLMLAVILNCFTGVMASTLRRCFRRIFVTARWRRLLISLY